MHRGGLREESLKKAKQLGAQQALGGPPLGDVDECRPQASGCAEIADRQAGTPPAFKARRKLNHRRLSCPGERRPSVHGAKKVARGERAAQLLRGPGAGVPGFPGDQPEPPAPLYSRPLGSFARLTSAPPRGARSGEAQSAGTKRHESQRMFESRKNPQ